MNVKRKRQRLIPKKRWLNTIESDMHMRAAGVCVDVEDQGRFRTKVANLK